MKHFILFILILVLTGCSSITLQRGEKGTDAYIKVRYIGPQKDFNELDYQFGDDMRLRAGEAITADQPWADIVGGNLDVMQAIMFCSQNPGLCNK